MYAPYPENMMESIKKVEAQEHSVWQQSQDV